MSSGWLDVASVIIVSIFTLAIDNPANRLRLTEMLMTKFEAPRVAIIGTGQIGRGWAALIVAAGWPVAIYDADADAPARAVDAISARVPPLVQAARAAGTRAPATPPGRGRAGGPPIERTAPPGSATHTILPA